MHKRTRLEVDGREVLATRMTAGVIRRVMREPRVPITDIENYLHGEMPPEASHRLIEHRRQNTIKAISRAREVLRDTIGDEDWLRTFKDRAGKMQVALK